MTRTVVYGGALLAFAAATGMTIASILLPRWVSYSVSPSFSAGAGNPAAPFWQTVGLHKLCASETEPMCRAFPKKSLDCSVASGLAGPFFSFSSFPSSSSSLWPADINTPHQDFCSVWRSVGFLMSLALVAELAALVGFVAILAGGRLKRESGWRMQGALLTGVGIVQLAALSLVAYLLDHDDRFLVPGWRLDSAWVLAAVSGSVALLCAFGLALSAVVLPPEDGYEFLRSTNRSPGEAS